MSAALEAAAALGRRITRSAIWHGGACSWLGVVPQRLERGRRVAPTAAPLGPDLYGGTAGVALFLAHLHATTGDADARRTALGALRHARDRAVLLDPARAFGLYDGGLGIAVVAARCSGAIGASDGLALPPSWVARSQVPVRDDLMSGAAGAVVGLLALAEATGDGGPAARARQIGSLMAARARPRLTGMAHGAAGMVHAFLALWRATGRLEYANQARRLAEHEAALYDPPTANWRDLRPPVDRMDDDGGDAVSAVAWCHGAPGIVLSRRLSAGAFDDGEVSRIAAAAQSTARWVDAALATGRGNLSLCHGLTGVVECLEETPGRGREALLVERIHEEHVVRRGRIPCGTPDGETPSLMLGLAGVGLFLLRTVEPSIPSVLALGPQDAEMMSADASRSDAATRRSGAPTRT